MIEVIGAGLPRTGTLSLKAALERLGFGPCYHMFEIYDHLELIDRWLPAVPDTPAGWERVFAGYRSTLDWPASFFWREQAAAFPRAKVVLTVRDPAGWCTSFHNMISLRAEPMPPDAPAAAVSFQASFARIQPLLGRIVRATFGEDLRFPDELPSEEQAARAFDRHVATVRQSLPADRLLVFDVREGWEPLCAFLDVDVPAGEPFPRLNDIEATKRRFEQFNLGRR
ncbi:sulfotransferase family protein [Microtetraspora sp. NBRC 13810]|uniref:sulfotransferase family protein n=1 Tax=Microtetraspora sp. NBRC 13810 TaxID=3030990 RepID=UPI0024A139F7|nr:sulfotransferase family protein [Microtetraspora sp. NBRC 13810]GLW09159.1 sulfotransferase family protein [Microtetraspora sp. NBRC 13810]